jgi:hypothetical protein
MLLLRNPKKGGQGPTWAVEPYDDDDDDEWEATKSKRALATEYAVPFGRNRCTVEGIIKLDFNESTDLDQLAQGKGHSQRRL